MAGSGPRHYWTRGKTNLEAKRLRLVFVADHIPASLQTVVEFLNEPMRAAEVIAVEVKQHRGGAMYGRSVGDAFRNARWGLGSPVQPRSRAAATIGRPSRRPYRYFACSFSLGRPQRGDDVPADVTDPEPLGRLDPEFVEQHVPPGLDGRDPGRPVEEVGQR